MAKPTLLIYGTAGERLAQLRAVCAALDVAAVPVPPSDAGQPVGALLGIMPRAEAAPSASVGEMLVLAAFDQALLKRFLDALRQRRIPPFPLKAMLTPTNVAWPGERLFHELSAEHDALRRSKSAVHPPAER